MTLPPCAIRGHHSRDAHKAVCRPAIDAAWSATRADPARYAELRARIAAQLSAQRHRDAERHSEARAGGAYITHHTALHDRARPCGMAPATVEWWTRIRREDRAADYAGMPPTMPGPILEAGHARIADRDAIRAAVNAMIQDALTTPRASAE